jgi:tRNA pseudouridine38-40 synthase
VGAVRYFIKIAFVGTHYHGWQSQVNADNTVQQVCVKALEKILRHDVSLQGAGRTDAGVHAEEIYAHFDTEKDLIEKKETWLYKFNSVVPFSIAFDDILAVKPDAHARFNAVERSYKYIITTKKDPFLVGFAYHFPHKLNMSKMNEAAALLKEYKEFSSFKKTHTQNKTDTCVIKYAHWEKQGNKLIFTITADRFLRNMVRAIVGTLINVGNGKSTVEDFCRIIENKNRSRAGASVPACGLYLAKVKYPAKVFL